MSDCEESRWQDHVECCENCAPCLNFENNIAHVSRVRKYVTLGSVRYGMRLGAVSPPPPGAGPRYRSQCCWPSAPVSVTRIPLLTAASATASTTINSRDIFSCVNRVRMTEDATTTTATTTSELADQQCGTVRDHLLNSSNFLLKTQLRRQGFVRTVVYDRLCGCDNGGGGGGGSGSSSLSTDLENTLDRLPRFRFGGNRGTGSSNRTRERDKRESEVKLRELTDRLKRLPPSKPFLGPVPPPRLKHMTPRICSDNQPGAGTATTMQEDHADLSDRNVPVRSASFSQLDYSTNDNKYVRRASRSTLPRIHKINPIANALSTENNKYNMISYVQSEEDAAESAAESAAQSAAAASDNTNTVTGRVVVVASSGGELQSDNAASSLIRCSSDNSRVKTADKDYQNSQENKRDKSRRRKGMYIAQWPNGSNPSSVGDDMIPQFVEDGLFASGADELCQLNDIPALRISTDKTNINMTADNATQSPRVPPSPDEGHTIEWLVSSTTSIDDPNGKRSDSLSEGENELNINCVVLVPSDVSSDCESRTSTTNDNECTPHIPRRYSKRPLRGPYGQMLEAEMKKPEADSRRKNQYVNDLKFLEALSTDSHATSEDSVYHMKCGGVISVSSGSGNQTRGGGGGGGGDSKPKYVTRTRSACNNSLDDDSQLKQRTTVQALAVTPASNNLNRITSKRKVSATDPMLATTTSPHQSSDSRSLIISHQRTVSSPSKLEDFPPTEASNELLEQLLRGSSEQLAAEANLHRLNDTRTHVVVELYDTERSYVESLQILVGKYLEPLKSPENAGLLDATLVDEIFFQIPALLNHHLVFLDELKKRLEHWDIKQKVGDVLIDMFSNSAVIESYTNYVNNWKRAREIYKSAQQSKPAFARFLEAMAREHKGKLALDSLLIKPIQKFPKYELLLQRLIKHTDSSHPDHKLLLSAQREIHDQLLKINCTERETLELEQLREIEGLIEGLIELVATDRQYLRHDFVSMAAGGSTRKERALFLFSDLLLVTSIKRRSGTIRRPATTHSHGHMVQVSVANAFGFDANKYKLLMKISLDDLEILRAKDENLRQTMLEIDSLTEDIAVLNQINDLAWSLHCSHTQVDELVRDMLGTMNKQLAEQQNSDSQLSCLDLTLNTPSGLENVSIVFSKPDKRASWEESFNEAKHKLAMSGDRRPCPELVATVPIRKTRAGLQFTCAAPTMGDNGKDVWVCNSDGYVGQVCILSLHPEPTVTSCNGVCNARILCVASVPALSLISKSPTGGLDERESCPIIEDRRNDVAYDECGCGDDKLEEQHSSSIQFDSSSSSDEEERSDKDLDRAPNLDSTTLIHSRKSAESDNRHSLDSDDVEQLNQESTMWLGTEDGCIHVYNSSDNIRMKKNKIRLQHGSSILSIIYLDDRVYVSLANGDIAVYERDSNNGSWNTSSPIILSIGSATMPVSKMLPNAGKLWCSCGNSIKVLDTQTLSSEHSFTVNNDPNKPIASIVVSGYGVWLSLQNSAIVKCFHSTSLEFLCEVNVAPAVTKMLTSCDDIIRQHKAACLRVTSLLTYKDLLWIGTSAGVLLTMPLPHITASTVKLTSMPTVMGVPHGHTGHVRFLTHVENYIDPPPAGSEHYNKPVSSYQRHSMYKGKKKAKTLKSEQPKLLIISGGDGYEDFRSSNMSEVAGREDSTNHLLLWHI